MQRLRAFIAGYSNPHVRPGGVPPAFLLVCAMALSLLLLLPGSSAWAQTSALGRSAGANESQVKAAYLYKFLNYVEWPPAAFTTSDSPYVIGIAGAEGVARSLDRITAGRKVNNRPVAIRRLQSTEDLQGLHILFAGNSDDARQVQWVKKASRQPILVVTDTEGMPPPESMVNFRLVDDRIRFDVFLEPAEASGIRINSRMLSVAVSVTKGTQ